MFPFHAALDAFTTHVLSFIYYIARWESIAVRVSYVPSCTSYFLLLSILRIFTAIIYSRTRKSVRNDADDAGQLPGQKV